MRKKRDPWERIKSAEAELARSLRSVANEIGRIVATFVNGADVDYPPMQAALERYSELLRPWAEKKAAITIAQVDKQDRRQWEEHTDELSRGLREIVQRTPLGRQYRELLDTQVGLITSLPIEAGRRAQKLAAENVITGQRSAEIADELARTTEVTKSRATLIARTETARAQSVLNQARAQNIGSKGYIWRTARDRDVRDSHRKMEGQYVNWNDPPTLDGLTGHAGTLPNCRCYAEPVIPKELLG